MSIFEYEDYKSYINEWVQGQPKKGRGLYSQMAKVLRTNTVTISQIFKGSRDLSTDQALALCPLLKLSGKEKEALLLLVQIERAATQELKVYLKDKIQTLKKEAQELSKRVEVSDRLPDEAKAEFYSDWLYSGLRLYAAREDMKTIFDIAEALGKEPESLEKAFQFLKSNGLISEKSGELEIGIRSTHLGSDSPFINNHRRNWRLLGIEKSLTKKSENLFYSGPMVLNQKDAAMIREKIIKFIAEITQDVQNSTCEQTACLNIDWFHF